MQLPGTTTTTTMTTTKTKAGTSCHRKIEIRLVRTFAAAGDRKLSSNGSSSRKHSLRQLPLEVRVRGGWGTFEIKQKTISHFTTSEFYIGTPSSSTSSRVSTRSWIHWVPWNEGVLERWDAPEIDQFKENLQFTLREALQCFWRVGLTRSLRIRLISYLFLKKVS